jgi:hypothetical protein
VERKKARRANPGSVVGERIEYVRVKTKLSKEERLSVE